MSPIRYEKDADNIVTLTFDAPGAPVNTMTEAWQSAFADAVARLQKEKDSIAGVILASAKKTFFAGAELKDVLKFGPNDGPHVFEWIQGVKKQMRALEKLGKQTEYHLIGSSYGHDAFLLEHETFAPMVRKFLEGVNGTQLSLNEK